MSKVNVLKALQKGDSINPFYDLYSNQMNEIARISKDAGELIINSFIFGYTQGVKAQKKGRAYSE